MNLLTNDFVNGCGRLFGPSEQFEGDTVELGLKGFCVNGRESRYPSRRDSADNGHPKVSLSDRINFLVVDNPGIVEVLISNLRSSVGVIIS
jgi:hypothetical protein